MERDRNPWNYLLSIERNFISTLDYVELHDANQNTFSNEYAKLLLLIGSEVDSVARLVASRLKGRPVEGIKECQAEITKGYLGMYEARVTI